MTVSTADLRAVESLLAFWAAAGVDTCLLDAPVDRLAAPPRPLRAAPAAVRPAPAPAVAPAAGLPAPQLEAAIAEAGRLASGAQDLAALAEVIAAFDGCGLKFEGARQAVTWRGAEDAPVMIIGEAPGGEEDVQGAPFVGRAGKLLDRMLAAAGLDGRVLITNTVFWRPPGNRTPTPAEQMACAPFVERAIQLAGPKMLLLSGGAAAKSLLKRDEGILAMRGRWFDWTAADESLTLPALPTLHPAFLLRQPAAKKRAWADLLTLTERLDRPARPD